MENWVCTFVYMCPSKLSKLAIALWEQSLHNKPELNAFLMEHHWTLEAIDDVRPSGTRQAQPEASASNKLPRRIKKSTQTQKM